MIPIKFNGKDYNVKTAWEEITLADFIALEKLTDIDELSLLGIISGIPHEELININKDSFDTALLQHLDFLSINANLMEREVPKTVTINGITIEPPTALDQCSWYQSRIIKKIISKSTDADGTIKKEKISELFRDCCTVYLQPLLNTDAPEGKKVDDKKYNDVEQLVLQMPVTEVYPLGAFFLTELVSF